jgi:uncharacterized repeat protein (TIGR03837 family)
MRAPHTVAIFCDVIDNFGDAGVCWRLARALALDHHKDVTLWINDLVSLKRLRPAIEVQAPAQQIDGFTVRDWQADAEFGAPADLVIEAFGCKLPDRLMTAMAASAVAPVWINLEYLSAEAWVEGCHALPSPHPRLALTKYFYFPGFSPRTGGLLKEAGLDTRCTAVQQDSARRRHFFDALGVTMPVAGSVVSLFCYPSAPLAALFADLQSGAPLLCLVPEGVASDAMAQVLGQPAVAGARITFGQLTVQIIPFLEPDAYDMLLWCCDLNFVRGEDSLVRAQWAGRPLVWQLYRQDAQIHLEKMAAFLQRYLTDLPPSVAERVQRCWRVWNGESGISADWPALLACLPQWRARSETWRTQLAAQKELAQGLIEFAGKIG